MADGGGVRLKKPTNFLVKFRQQRSSPLNRMQDYFLKAGDKALKRRQQYVSKFDRPPGFSLVVHGSAGYGILRVAIERDDSPAESASLSRWELINIAQVQKMYFSKDWVSKTSHRNLRTKKGNGVRTGLGQPKQIDPRYQIYRLNERIVADLKARFKRGNIDIKIKSPWEQYAKPGDK
jgi:hypothetical protein